jgi:hypothetical protein
MREVKNRDTRRACVGFFSIVEIADLQDGRELIFYFRFPLDG